MTRRLVLAMTVLVAVVAAADDVPDVPLQAEDVDVAHWRRAAEGNVDDSADAGVALVVCITEGIPTLDMLTIKARLSIGSTRLIGPNCPGVIDRKSVV